jgi:Tol biopolymer transport system component
MSRMMWAIAALLAVVPLAAQKPEAADTLMQTAIKKEVVDGNMAAAIEGYKKALAAAKGNRVIAAQALVHMAECYQKLGDAEALKIWEQIVREYGDQREAVATARARLGGKGGTDSGIVTRQVWTGPDVDAYGGISVDGRLLSFTDWKTGDLAIHDLTTGLNRRLTDKKDWIDPTFAMGSAISRDGKQVAYGWGVVSPGVPVKDHFAEVRLIDMNGGKPRTLFASHDVAWAYVHDWSADGQWLAVDVDRADRTRQIGLVSTVNGSIRVLKSIGWHDTTKMAFSPDGKYLAYDRVVNDDSQQREIHVLTVIDGSETAALMQPANDTVLGWSPDGTRLLFASDRSGSRAVWGLPLKDGKGIGQPALIKPNVSPRSLGITRSGALYYSVVASEKSIYVASADFDTGKVLSAPKMFPQQYFGSNDFPAWSADGKYLAYLSQRDSNTRSTFLTGLAILSMETGKVRELRPNLSSIYATGNKSPLWSPDGKFLVVTGTDTQGGNGIYRVDAETGETIQLIRSQRDESAVAFSPDGRTLYIRGRNANIKEIIVLARDIQSGREREILRTTPQVGRGLSLSPDGRWLAYGQPDPTQNSTSLRVVSVEGGDPRELARSSAPESLIGALSAWTPDSQSLLFLKDPGNGAPRQLWRVGIGGGAARRVELNAEWVPALGIPGAGPASFHPNGRDVAFVMGEHTIEIWAMENFFPSAAAKR